MNLNLEAKNKQEEIIKKYLEDNAGEILADKINNGVKIVKDNKTLINKKSLSGFMQYACNEARKQAGKGSNCACVEDEVVFGWAIHYFEEDSIEEKLYNEDGSEYQKAVEYTPPKKVEVKPPKKENEQTSLFSFFTETKEEKQEEKTTEMPDYYKEYLEAQKQYPDSIVITKLGDFFEIFGSCVQMLAEELNLVAIKRDLGSQKIDMLGFPVHISDKYISKIREKHSLTIIEDGNFAYFEKKVKQENDLLIDMSTGEVLNKQNQTFDNHLIKAISNLLDGKVKLQ